MLGLRQRLKELFGVHKLHKRIDWVQAHVERKAIEQQERTEALPDSILKAVRAEYTGMPRFLFHQPLDVLPNTYPISFAPPVAVEGCDLLVPPPDDRMGYSPDDVTAYLEWGKFDHDRVMGFITQYAANLENCKILDFGCSSGRVLRHFDAERRQHGWKLSGVDVQARPIEWMRYHLPSHFEVSTCSTMPHLPFADSSVDFIYGISVFTHIKYLWDAWLLELKRILKPNGLLIQTIHAEFAWEAYHVNRQASWIHHALPAEMLEKPKMDVDYFYWGDATVSQVFWKEAVARKFWGRYVEVLEVAPPSNGFQSWMICRKVG
jgi:SAM-dependent methyltransferase